MHLQRRPGGPIRIAPVRPWLRAPARVHERRWQGDVFRPKHILQHGEDFLFRDLVVLGFDLVGRGSDDGAEEDAGSGEEVEVVEGLEDRVPAALGGVGVEEELGGCVPEDGFGGELHEDLGVGAH
jgi:hypothetical protein